MISEIVLALGLVLVLEGLFLVVAPKRWESVLRMIGAMPVDTRRLIGLVTVAIGVGVVWLARNFLL